MSATAVRPTECPDDPGHDGDVDEPAIAELFYRVQSLWEVLGATDAAQRLTPLGWWGLPEALQKAWSPARWQGRAGHADRVFGWMP